MTGAEDACQSRLSNFSTDAGKAMKAARTAKSMPLPTVSDMTPVLTDTRGPFTFVIYSGPNGANGTCISGPSFTSLSTRSGGAQGPPAGKIVSSFQAHTAHGADAYSFVEGHAGAGVIAAALTLSDGSQVQTTLQNGWLVAGVGGRHVGSGDHSIGHDHPALRYPARGSLPAASGLHDHAQGRRLHVGRVRVRCPGQGADCGFDLDDGHSGRQRQLTDLGGAGVPRRAHPRLAAARGATLGA